MSEAFTAGQALAERHQQAKQPDATPITVIDLPNLSERQRAGGWTLRSALVRFAQPEPVRSAVIMDFVRRSEAVLQPLQSALADGSLIELGRLLGTDAESTDREEAILDGYRSVLTLPDDIEATLALVRAVLLLDDLGGRLALWAPTAPTPAPVADVDATCTELRQRFKHLDVPSEAGPPGPGRGRRR